MGPSLQIYHYRLLKSTMGIAEVNFKATAITVPSGALLLSFHPISGESGTCLIQMQWERQTVSVFARDILERAKLTTPGPGSGIEGKDEFGMKSERERLQELAGILEAASESVDAEFQKIRQAYIEGASVGPDLSGAIRRLKDADRAYAEARGLRMFELS